MDVMHPSVTDIMFCNHAVPSLLNGSLCTVHSVIYTTKKIMQNFYTFLSPFIYATLYVLIGPLLWYWLEFFLFFIIAISYKCDSWPPSISRINYIKA